MGVDLSQQEVDQIDLISPTWSLMVMDNNYLVSDDLLYIAFRMQHEKMYSTVSSNNINFVSFKDYYRNVVSPCSIVWKL